MAQPWDLVTRPRADSVKLYYSWMAIHHSSVSKTPMLCNQLPLALLVRFAAANGVRLAIDSWPGHAPTDGGKRHWDTSRTHVYDSHGGGYATETEFAVKVGSKVTARMIGTLNTVAIEKDEARPGDLILHDYSASYWHVEFITSVASGVLQTQAGSTPAVAPADHTNRYRSLGGSVFEDKPRRWQFEEIFPDSGG